MSTSVRSLCMLFSVILSTVIIPSKAKDNQCGAVTLVTEKLDENGTLKIEYRPSRNLMPSINSTIRKWARFVDGRYGEVLELNAGTYTEKKEQNYKYVLTIYRFNVSMNGQYMVYCGYPVGRYTDPVTVNLPEPPSVPVIIGLQDIENCRHCIVGEDNTVVELVCVIHGGTRPLIVTMTIGYESYTPQELNTKTYMKTFLVKNHHHMKNVIFSVINDALSSPLSVTAQMYVIIPPSGVMLEVNAVGDSPSQMYANCTVYGSNPACNAQISAPSGITGSKMLSRNISLPHGAWNSVSEVNLNVSEEDNGKDITCVADCDEFSVDLTDTVKILLPYKVDEEDKYNNKQRTTGQALDKSIIWIILGAGVLLVVIIVIAVVFVVFRKKGQTLEGSKPQLTVSHGIELTGAPTALDTYEQLQNRTDTEIRGTYDFLEVNSSVQQSSQSQYESLNQDAEKYHTYTDLKQSR